MQIRHVRKVAALLCFCVASTQGGAERRRELRIVERPSAADISPDGKGVYKFYSGQWYTKRREPHHRFVDTRHGLRIPLGGEIASASNASTPGKLPLITLSKGVFIEFDVALSSNDRDHWPAVWLMPIQHDARQSDQKRGAPRGVEHWVEVDVDEGGFASGTHGVMIEWSGRWPNYTRMIYGKGDTHTFLDRTKFNRFGYSYDPVSKSARWWLNGVPSAPYPVRWMPDHDYYIIVSAQTHGKNKPYHMTLRSVTVSRFPPKD